MSQANFCMLAANIYIAGQSTVPDGAKAILMLAWILLGLFCQWKGL